MQTDPIEDLISSVNYRHIIDDDVTMYTPSVTRDDVSRMTLWKLVEHPVTRVVMRRAWEWAKVEVEKHSDSGTFPEQPIQRRDREPPMTRRDRKPPKPETAREPPKPETRREPLKPAVNLSRPVAIVKPMPRIQPNPTPSWPTAPRMPRPVTNSMPVRLHPHPVRYPRFMFGPRA